MLPLHRRLGRALAQRFIRKAPASSQPLRDPAADIRPTARRALAEAHARRARALQGNDPRAAADAAARAHAADPQPWRAKWLAFRAYDAGELARPAALLHGLPADLPMAASEHRRRLQIRAQAAWLACLPELPPQAEPAYAPEPQSLLYCAASALPWHTSGYTARTQSLLRALAEAGVTVTALTRPGYPWDRPDSAGTPEGATSHHDGIDWHHLRHPTQSLPLDAYVERAAQAIMRVARNRRVAVIHAASNHVNALPALIAARRLGLPFHYELRGLWELSRAAQHPHFAGSDRQRLGLALEALVARHATRVFAISQALADHVVREWGLDPARVALLPNAVEAERFAAIAPPRLPRFTIGYAGALVGYEGLDLLLDALALLRGQGRRIDLLVIGDGPHREALEQQATALGLRDAVTFAGACDPATARLRLAACHATCLPRRRSAVTELVPPLKLVEAMALGLPVIAPDLPVLREEAGDHASVAFVPPDDVAALAAAIAALHDDPAAKLAHAAEVRATVLATRDWAGSATRIAALLPRPAPDPAADEARRKAAAQAEAAALTTRARALQDSDPAQAAALAAQACAWDPQPWRSKWLALRQYEAGELARPAQGLATLPDTLATSRSEDQRIAQIRAQAAWLACLPELPPQAEPAYAPEPQSLLYCAASALPWHTNGYTARTQSLLRALANAGVTVTALTRPGYPWDRPDSAGTPEGATSHHDGIDWHHLRHPAQSLPLDTYVERAAQAIMRVARNRRVAVIHAASNHVNALPALIAARRLGLPFHYELRGLWELSRAAQHPHFAGSDRQRLGLALEALVARHATRVFPISQALADHVVREWSLDPARVALLPNAVEAEHFAAIAPPRLPRFTIGYAGALVGYEGLDLLLDAVALLHGQGHCLDLLVIGDGPRREALEQQATALGLRDAVTFAGACDPATARLRLAACHATCLPRRRSAVTELVPPLKLVEALALGLPVIAPDLPVLREEAGNHASVAFVPPDDVAALAAAIAALHDAPAAMLAHAAEVRATVLTTRDWHVIAPRLAATLPPRTSDDDDLVEEPADEVSPVALPWAIDDPHEAASAWAAGDPGLARARIAALALADPAQAARIWLRLGHLAADRAGPAIEAEAAEAALACDRSLATLIAAHAAFQRAAAFDRCADVFAEARHHPAARDRTLRERVERLRDGIAGQLDMLRLIPPRAAMARPPLPGRIAYVLHNSLPHASGGYATRAHGLAQGLAGAGYEVVALTRPGYPHDLATSPPDPVADTHPVPEPADATVIDGVGYHRIAQPARSGMRYRDYVPAAACALEQRLRTLRPELVMAASNHLVALSALIAARRLGLPFVYEVRGLWEVTRLSREPGFAQSAAFRAQVLLETGVCRVADRVLTLTGAMRDELVTRGVPRAAIGLLPNACDPARFAPLPRDAALARASGLPEGVPVIGYVGTFVDYEGLDDLARACGLLKARGLAFRLVLVGSEDTGGSATGPVAAAIRAVAEASGFADWLVLPGRVPHAMAARWYSLIDICPFPRKPWPVCEMVSPMKPLEAMAMAKAVLASDVAALAGMIAPGRTGLTFAKGDVAALADALARLIADPALRASLGQAARTWVQQERTWTLAGAHAARELAPWLSRPGREQAA